MPYLKQEWDHNARYPTCLTLDVKKSSYFYQWNKFPVETKKSQRFASLKLWPSEWLLAHLKSPYSVWRQNSHPLINSQLIFFSKIKLTGIINFNICCSRFCLCYLFAYCDVWDDNDIGRWHWTCPSMKFSRFSCTLFLCCIVSHKLYGWQRLKS